MWPFNKRKWILVIGESDPEHIFTDIECISTKKYECVNKACSEIFDWIKHKKEVFGGNYIEKEDCWDEDDEDPDAWVPCHEIDLYDTEDEDK